MKANNLIGRDPALAAIMGALGGGSSDIGTDFGSEFGLDVHDDELMGDYDDDDDLGDDDDDDWGEDDDDYVGASRRRRSRGRGRGLPRVSRRTIAKLFQSRRRTQSRERILNPNRNSNLKVERYAFTISQAITLGTAVTFTTLTGQPDTTIRPQRVSMNAPTPMFAFIQEIKVANVSVTVGTGLEDAFNYNALGVGQSLDMPTLSPANKATVLGSYSGFVPPGFAGGTATNFSVSFRGPSSVVA
ncbi:MAG: hypothetical protein R3321_00995 [Nitrososphaeraceae archaeon]|nr:hypothetical protein [Nitrososphaeraceae archaeon]